METQTHDFIHPTALVHPQAKLGSGTRVGPYSIIGPETVTGENCDIQEHVVIRGRVKLGNDCKVFPFAVIGGEPQHLGYKNEPTEVVIGDRVVLREHVTIHRGTVAGGGITKLGNDGFVMAYTHIGHDCLVGNKAIIVNSVQLAGHVVVEDFVTIGGQSEVVQHCRIGKYCYIAGGSTIRKDVPPFLTGKGNEFQIQGINKIGMERAGVSSERIASIKKIFKIFYLQKLTVAQAIEKITMDLSDSEDADSFLSFIKSSKAGIHR